MIKIPFNDTSRTFELYKSELLSAINSVAESGWWLLGKHTQLFADEFAKYCGTTYCLPLGNGTDALEIALRTILSDHLEDERCEVITVANAGGYSSTACRLIGAIPVYADINADTHLISLPSIENCLSADVKAIVLTHLYGAAIDVKSVRNLLNSHGYHSIKIIEDCAQAHGALVNGELVGSLGDIATFSFYPTKNLGAMGDGGAITCSNKHLYDIAKSLHQYGWSSKYKISLVGGRNSRMDEIQAAVLNCLLPHLDEFNAQRKLIYKRYSTYNCSKFSTLNYKSCDHVGHLAVCLVDNRDGFIKFMNDKNIAVDVHYPIFDIDQPAWANLESRIDPVYGLVESRKIQKQIISLPCYPTLTEQELNYICDSLKEWLQTTAE